MAEQTAGQPLSLARALGRPAAAAILAGGMSVVALRSTDAVLGGLIGGLVASGLAGAGMAAGLTTIREKSAVWAGVVIGSSLTWAHPLGNEQIDWVQAVQAMALLAAWSLAVVAIAGIGAGAPAGRAGERTGRHSQAGGGVAALLAVAWLMSPVWGARLLAEPSNADLSAAVLRVHPISAMNGVVEDLGVSWPQMPMGYAYMNLNQDVPYTTPATVTASVLWHGGLGVVVLAVGGWVGRRRREGRPVESDA